MHDPKKLSGWLELDYFQRPRLLVRLNRVAMLVAALAALAFAGYSVMPGNHALHQAGPVSDAHAMFNQNCATCHGESFQPLLRLVPGHEHAMSVKDATCLQCHDGAHHQHTVPAHDCAACHREHRGRRMLAHVPDSHCTACHADIHAKAGPTELRNVDGFSLETHPPFRWWPQGKNDPGTIAFNHQVHLAPEGVFDIDLTQIAHQWQGQPPFTPKRVQLDCGSCHQPDAAGRYMKPINFEQHCQRCHPLLVQVAGKPDRRLADALAAFAAEPAPHRSPKTVRAELRQRYVSFATKHKNTLLDLPPMKDAEPPRLIPRRPGPAPIGKFEWEWVDRQLWTAEKTLFTGAGGCRFCHAPPARWTDEQLPEYPASQVNKRRFNDKIGESERWFPQAHFQHERHRMLQCTECHAAATSRKTGDVLMPALQTCVNCHKPHGGARADCVTCHLFHARGEAHPWKMPGLEPWKAMKKIFPAK